MFVQMLGVGFDAHVVQQLSFPLSNSPGLASHPSHGM